MAFDAEYTSANPKNAKMVAFAIVPLEGEVIRVSRSKHVVVSQAYVGESAKVHGITGKDGISEREALDLLYREVNGQTLIVFGRLDVNYLRRTYGKRLKANFVDVAFGYLKWVAGRDNVEYVLMREGLNLVNICRKLNICVGDFVFHDSLVDAIHTALLYLKLRSMGTSFKLERL
ncbi:MAG: hypothetical protein NZ957_04530 [Thaumarchaeota archaeon]|nr:hypothetical protein [Candidatus Calditenuaceae archaeon]